MNDLKRLRLFEPLVVVAVFALVVHAMWMRKLSVEHGLILQTHTELLEGFYRIQRVQFTQIALACSSPKRRQRDPFENERNKPHAVEWSIGGAD